MVYSLSNIDVLNSTAKLTTELKNCIRKDHQCRTLLLSDLPNYKNVLLLQGPLGPFFKNLAQYWRMRGASVTKVNFNSGDDYFYPKTCDQVIQFKDKIEFWPEYLSNLLAEKNIEAIFLFGDCRKIHQPARSLCELLGIDLFIFEEGYIRPHLFTLEKTGINHHSFVTKLNLDCIRDSIEAQHEPPIRLQFSRSYWYMLRWGFTYWLISLVDNYRYPNYTHHRILDIMMGWNWVKSFFRYWLYQIIDKRKIDNLLKNKSGKKNASKLFFLPLQVHDDSQITTHSDFDSIEEVIERVISSFANHLHESKRADTLVIKHHPMDRGHKSYGRCISKLASQLGIQAHIVYIYDISVPKLLNQSSGCVTVNSTIGLQALHHNVMTINLGRSFYDKPGLTFQGTLDEFWSSSCEVVPENIKAFRNFLLHHTQINGSLYDPSYRLR
jgi:capsular polysaccharide export protein